MRGRFNFNPPQKRIADGSCFGCGQPEGSSLDLSWILDTQSDDLSELLARLWLVQQLRCEVLC